MELISDQGRERGPAGQVQVLDARPRVGQRARRVLRCRLLYRRRLGQESWIGCFFELDVGVHRDHVQRIVIVRVLFDQSILITPSNRKRETVGRTVRGYQEFSECERRPRVELGSLIHGRCRPDYRRTGGRRSCQTRQTDVAIDRSGCQIGNVVLIQPRSSGSRNAVRRSRWASHWSL